MSSIKQIVFRIIGLVALTASISYLLYTVSEMGKISTIGNFFALLMNLIIHGIAMYGGYQLLRTKDIGRKLLMIWYSFQLLTTVFVSFGVVYSTFFAGNIQISSPAQIPFPMIVVFHAFGILALLFLTINKIPRESSIEINRHIYTIATILSVVAPGLGRAVVGNFVAGMILFYIYGLLMTATVSSIGNPEYMIWLGQLLYHLVVWRVFSAIDWFAVKNFEKTIQPEFEFAPDLSSGQGSGG